MLFRSFSNQRHAIANARATVASACGRQRLAPDGNGAFKGPFLFRYTDAYRYGLGRAIVKKWSPICAPGWMSMPVEEWASSDITRAVSVMPS